MSRAASSHAQVLDTFAGIGHAMAHPARLRMLSLLAQAPKTVTALADGSGESVANASAHLAVLSDAGLVAGRREGRHVRYALADETVADLVSALRGVAETVAPPAVRKHLSYFDGPDVAPLTPTALRERLRAGVALIDVRPADEFAAGHLPGARSAPVGLLRERVPDIAGAGPLLVYCRGRYCLSALEGVRLLSRADREVMRLPFGVTEWRASGFPLETG